MARKTASYEVLDTAELVVSADASEGALISLECFGGTRVRLVFAPLQLAKLEALLARANLEQAKLQPSQ